MSLKDAKQNLKAMGKTIAQNTPGPKELLVGAKETARGVWPIWLAIIFLVLFAEPIIRWLVR